MEAAAHSPASYTSFVLTVLVELLTELRTARSMADVNIAAGRAWQGLEPYLAFAEEVEAIQRDALSLGLDLASQGPDEFGQVIDLPA